jgi:hypothetical protein
MLSYPGFPVAVDGGWPPHRADRAARSVRFLAAATVAAAVITSPAGAAHTPKHGPGNGQEPGHQRVPTGVENLWSQFPLTTVSNKNVQRPHVRRAQSQPRLGQRQAASGWIDPTTPIALGLLTVVAAAAAFAKTVGGGPAVASSLHEVVGEEDADGVPRGEDLLLDQQLAALAESLRPDVAERFRFRRFPPSQERKSVYAEDWLDREIGSLRQLVEAETRQKAHERSAG